MFDIFGNDWVFFDGSQAIPLVPYPGPNPQYSGLDYFDVAAAEKRDYKLHFYAHKEGFFSAKIFFRNEATGEFVVYLVQFKALVKII